MRAWTPRSRRAPPRGARASRRCAAPWAGPRARARGRAGASAGALVRVRSATRSSRWSRAGAARARGRRGGPRAGPAHAGRRGRPRQRRSRRSCRACARSCASGHELGGTRTQPSPRSMRKRSGARRRGGSPRARSGARDRGERPRRGAARGPASAATVSSPSDLAGGRRRATAVWLFLCGSIPSTIMRCPLSDASPKLRDRRWTGLGRGL